MPAATILYILFAALVAAGVSYYFYFLKKRRSTRNKWLLAFLRFTALFAIFLLLINPKFLQQEHYIEKPELFVLVDNSASVKRLSEVQELRSNIAELLENPKIQDRFDVETYAFGDEIEIATDFNFSEKGTNIYQALNAIGELKNDEPNATLLFTDGNQTYGRDYTFFNFQKDSKIIPVVVGDTTSYVDISIDQLNANKYAFLENKFPIEIFLNYEIEEDVQQKLRIKNNDKTIFSEVINLDAEKNSEIISLLLNATSTGLKSYTAVIEPLEDEKNKLNNRKDFAVEVIDERSKVLVLTAISHPDMGALKRSVESNQQRSLTVKNLNAEDYNLEDYQLLILYQPTAAFQQVFEEIKRNNSNFLIIGGVSTNWHFLNSVQEEIQKEVSASTEEIFPLLNENYPSYQIDEIDFDDYPPLKGLFGELKIKVPHQVLLFQKISGIETEKILLATYENNTAKRAVLLGENIWKWRAHSFVENGSFENFDEFFGNLVQFLASKKKKDRLQLKYEPFFYENDEIIVTAQYFDENFEFDARKQLILKLKNDDEQLQNIPFVVTDNHYRVNLGILEPGTYNFDVSVIGENISESGKFVVRDFDIEQQFLNANVDQLQQLANAQGEEVFYISEKQKLLNRLLNDPNLKPIQKSDTKEVPLIDWYYLLIIIIACLSTEWFMRKYYGLI